MAETVVVEDSIKTSKSWDDTFIRPGVSAAEQRQFQKAKVVDRVVEGRDKSRVRNSSVFVRSRSDKVEVPGEDPGTSEKRSNLSKLGEETGGFPVI